MRKKKFVRTIANRLQVGCKTICQLRYMKGTPLSTALFIFFDNVENGERDFGGGQWDVLRFHFYGATAGAYYQAFLWQTQSRAAASLPGDSPVSAQMSALLALVGEDGGGFGRDLDVMTALLCGLILGAARQRLQPVPAVLQKVRQYLHEQYAQKIRSARSRRTIISANNICSAASGSISASRRANI